MQSDNGDGTYTNPVIAADFPDPDVILVDDVYHFVSTTMFVFPGVTILKSYDLVNWEFCSNAVSRFDFSPCYDLDGCSRYGHGQCVFVGSILMNLLAKNKIVFFDISCCNRFAMLRSAWSATCMV